MQLSAKKKIIYNPSTFCVWVCMSVCARTPFRDTLVILLHHHFIKSDWLFQPQRAFPLLQRKKGGREGKRLPDSNGQSMAVADKTQHFLGVCARGLKIHGHKKDTL